MKIQQKLAAALAVLTIISNIAPAYTVKADRMPLESGTIEEKVTVSSPLDFLPKPQNTKEGTAASLSDALRQKPAGTGEKTAASPSDALRQQAAGTEEDIYPSDAFPQKPAGIQEESTASSSDASRSESSSGAEWQEGVPVPAEMPEFKACIEHDGQGYYVYGTFAVSASDLAAIQLLYSLDGEAYTVCGLDLKLPAAKENEPKSMQNQFFLRPFAEPFKSYIDKAIDCFYLKLRFIRKDETAFESQTVSIDRGKPQPLPEEITSAATFASSMSVTEWWPWPARRYGRYQLTIRADAAPKDIAAYLPDTLPIKINLFKMNLFFADDTIDCPVTWKPVTLPRLTAGDSVTILDAAEEMIIPADTVLNTPMGIFVLDKPTRISQDNLEVRLVLNVISENENPTGTLMAENSGLHMAFDLKPTGAAAIHAYSLSAGDTKWSEVPSHLLLGAVNAQPLTASSSHALVISRDWEPYRSYLEAENSGGTPAPFLVGLKIEGGVYDGRQLILPWPGTYDIPLQLPKLEGSGGNQGNAGNGSKGDGTEEGQRPYLPADSQGSPAPSEAESEELPTQPQESALSPADKQEDPFSDPPKTSQPVHPEEESGQETEAYWESESKAHTSETAVQTGSPPPESPNMPKPSNPNANISGGPDQGSQPHRENDFVPGGFEIVFRTDSALFKAPGLSQTPKAESQAAEPSGLETEGCQEPESAAGPLRALPQPRMENQGTADTSPEETSSETAAAAETENGSQAVQASPEPPAVAAHPAAASAMPGQKNASDSKAGTYSPLLPIAAAAAICLAISSSYVQRAKKIADKLRRLLFKK